MCYDPDGIRNAREVQNLQNVVNALTGIPYEVGFGVMEFYPRRWERFGADFVFEAADKIVSRAVLAAREALRRAPAPRTHGCFLRTGCHHR